MVLGFLLARAGVDVVVLEKHGDFLRDFRGDTIHPSTLQVLHELGLLDDFLQRPHQEATHVSGVVGGVEVQVADFSHLPTRCRFIGFMPQWDFLNFVSEQARRYPTFHLRMRAVVQDLIEERGTVAGLRATTPEGPLEIRARLTVGADGRHSTTRAKAGLEVEDIGAPIDVLWMRISRHEADPNQPLGHFNRGKILVTLFRGDYWQCAFVISKGGIDGGSGRKGLESFRAEIAEITPFPGVRPGRRDQGLGRREALDGRGRSPSDLAPTRPALHRGRGARDVAGRGRRHQSGDPLTPLLRGQYPGGACPRRAPAAGRPRSSAKEAGVPDPVDPAPSGRVQKSGDRTGDRKRFAALPAVAPPAVARFPFLRRIPARLIGMGFRPEHVRTPDVLGSP